MVLSSLDAPPNRIHVDNSESPGLKLAKITSPEKLFRQKLQTVSPCPNLITSPSIVSELHPNVSSFTIPATEPKVYNNQQPSLTKSGDQSEREKTLTDKIKMLQKLMKLKEGEFAKNKALWVQKNEMQSIELSDARQKHEKEKLQLLMLIADMKMVESPTKFSPFSMDTKINLKDSVASE